MTEDPAEPSPEEAILAPAVASRPWYRRRSTHRLAVGAAVLVLAGAVGVLVTGPDGDTVETVPVTVADKAGKKSGQREVGPEAGRAEVGGGDEVQSEPGSGEGTRRRRSRSKRAGSDKVSDDRPSSGKGKGKGKGRGSGPGSATPGSSSNTTPGSTVPASGVLSAAPDPLAPFGTLTVSADRPCPAGTTSVHVVATASGGLLDGQVLADRSLTPDQSGAWAVDPFTVAALGGVEGAWWAAAAERVTVSAACAGGPTYAPASVALAALSGVPTIEAAWDGSVATATVTACPTLARLELYRGPAAPALPPPAPAAVADLTAQADEAEQWSGSVELAGFDSAAEGLWATVACLDATRTVPLWRYPLVELDAP